MEVDVSQLKKATRPLVVIDDVVTRGTSFIAAVALLGREYPGAVISAFAMVRAVGGQGTEIEVIPSSCRGTIRPDGNWGRRQP